MKTAPILLLLPFILSAAITTGPTVNWDVRTTGSDSNGGAFDSGVSSPGTDESQANAGTAVTVTIQATTTQGISIPVFSATTHGPGNFYNQAASAGCTAGRYEMLSQAAGTATFDRSLGTAAAVCTGTLGGSLVTIQAVATATAAGNTINVKAGTYTLTSAVTLAGASNWIGYNATHQDRGTKPLITTATNSTNLFSTTGVVTSWLFRNFSFSNTAGTRGVAFGLSNGNDLSVNDSIMDGFNPAINGGATTVSLSAVEVKNSVAEGFTVSTLVVYVASCWFHNNGGSGINAVVNNSNIVVGNSIFSANANGIATSNNAAFELWATNSDFANNTTDGVNFGTNSNVANTVGFTAFTNNIFYGNGRYGINYGGGTPNGQNYLSGNTNAYGANTTNNLNGVLPTPGDLTLTANPFTSSTNFALNATAGGGPVVAGTGYPGVFPGGTTTGTINVGAVQSSGGTTTSTQVAYPRE